MFTAALLISSVGFADVPRDSEPARIVVVSPHGFALEKARAHLDGDPVMHRVKGEIARQVERWRKKGVWIPEARAREDLAEIPKGSMKVQMVSETELKPGEQFELAYEASVAIPESADGQFVVEAHIVRHRGRSCVSSTTLGFSQRPTVIRLGQKGEVKEPGEYDVLCILAIRAIKDAKAEVLDAVEVSYTVLAKD